MFFFEYLVRVLLVVFYVCIKDSYYFFVMIKMKLFNIKMFVIVMIVYILGWGKCDI